MRENIAICDTPVKTECRHYPQQSQRDPCYERDMRLRLKELRLERNLTQKQVAERAGMSVSYYTEIETGRKQINARRMDLIAKALGVFAHDLIVSQENPAEAQLIEDMRSLDAAKRRLVYDLARTLAQGAKSGS